MAQDNRMTSALDAIETYDNKTLLTILNEGIDLEGIGRDGVTMLYHACCQSNHFAFDELRRRGADLHKTSQNGQTPIFGAISSCSISILRRVLEEGGNMNDTDDDARTALSTCVEAYRDYELTCPGSTLEAIRLLLAWESKSLL